MCNNQCGNNRFNDEPFVEIEDMVEHSRHRRCCENRCVRQFAHCLRECRREDRCGGNRCGCHRCGYNNGCNR